MNTGAALSTYNYTTIQTNTHACQYIKLILNKNNQIKLNKTETITNMISTIKNYRTSEATAQTQFKHTRPPTPMKTTTENNINTNIVLR